MTNTNTQQEDWAKIPPGTLSLMVKLEKSRQRRAFLVKAGATVSSIAIASTVSWFVIKHNQQPNEPNFGGITCTNLRKLAPRYLSKTLDSKVEQQITTHLEKCNNCKEFLKSLT